MKDKKGMMKLIGFGAMVLGFVATQIGDWVNTKQMEETIEEKVNEALAEKEAEES